MSLHGYEVITASNGLDAIKAVRAERPDLVLMDMRMPKMDGWEATRLLRQERSTGNIPILALTAQTLDSDLQRCWDAGVDAIVPKPVQFHNLMKQIDKFLAHRLTSPPHKTS